MIEAELKALSDLAEDVLMAWLAAESPTDKQRQQALALLADAGMLLFNAHKNLMLHNKNHRESAHFQL
ncbi:hypothetical protein NP590_08410 [Methylomonas sp. SURF-2]|uniref:Uncharacterized protein n=1 Tax=Methylomonas subterranea TaxID=2952225 RepID=A0ABT1TF80_9GAMM|nr:hypothetical protein [Methylomonas sp. SURF-2]MCQ8104123.1 hypothetical protein [Methylomonas sp. SURF-2]